MRTEFEFSWAEMVDADPEGYEKLVNLVVAKLESSDLGLAAAAGHEEMASSDAEIIRDYRDAAVAVLKAIWEDDE